MSEMMCWNKLYADEEYDARHAYGVTKSPFIRSEYATKYL